LLAQALEAEVAALLASKPDKLTQGGRKRLVRREDLPDREITIHWPVAVRLRDRSEGSEFVRFSSALLPPYARRPKSLKVLIALLYLKGILTGNFEERLVVLLGKDAGEPSARIVGRLNEVWWEEHGVRSTRYEFSR
jgi:putative transposase